MQSKKSYLVALLTGISLQANNTFFNDPFGDNIFKEMMQMQQEMDKMFDQMHERVQQRSSKLIRPLGTYKIANKQKFIDKGKSYDYVTNIPENKENQIDIKVKDGVLSMTAKIIEKHENKSKKSFSSFSSMRMYQQSIPLPKDADEEHLNAGYINGKLVITIQKKKPTGNPIHTSPQKKTDKVKITDPKEVQKNDTNISKEKNTINSDLTSMS